MDLDVIVTHIMVAVMVLSPILSVVLIVLNAKQKKRIDGLSVKVDELSRFINENNKQNLNQIRDELGKQRTLLTQSLSSINDNVTRGVISMSKK
ncbi:MAG: hypothetical protein IJM56_05990 [Clostridia bacterium]|nr:hypothetical protein [Clostridia bacterium]